jgi:transcriptional regulator with XRE-family HTH domain
MFPNTEPKNRNLVKKIGLRISTLREIKGFSLSKFSQYVQIPVEDLEQYEKGSKAMTIDEIATIADALEIAAFHFFL